MAKANTSQENGRLNTLYLCKIGHENISELKEKIQFCSGISNFGANIRFKRPWKDPCSLEEDLQ